MAQTKNEGCRQHQHQVPLLGCCHLVHNHMVSEAAITSKPNGNTHKICRNTAAAAHLCSSTVSEQLQSLRQQTHNLHKIWLPLHNFVAQLCLNNWEGYMPPVNNKYCTCMSRYCICMSMTGKASRQNVNQVGPQRLERQCHSVHSTIRHT